MRITRKHKRTQSEAKQRLIGLANTMGMELQWVDEQSATGSMSYNGVTVSGAAQVTDTEVVLDVELPRLARMFSSRIQKQVEKEMDKVHYERRHTETSLATVLKESAKFPEKNGLATFLLLAVLLAGLRFLVLPAELKDTCKLLDSAS